ncbi:MAG: glycosyltransferase [Glaciecola sp.]|jgi:glycosyltransferase involved in cell wall biosynthesis
MQKNNPTKHVLFVFKYYTQGGGVEKVNLNLASSLKNQGLKVSIAVLSSHNDYANDFSLLKDEFSIIDLSNGKRFYRKLKSLLNLVDEQNVTSIISATETANVFALMCKVRFPRLRVVFTRHASITSLEQNVGPITIYVLYNLYAMFGEVVGVSKAIVAELKRWNLLNRESVNYIPNAVLPDSNYIATDRTTESWQNEPYFIAVGRLVETKGFDLLIQAYAIAKQKSSDIPKLIILGDGPERKNLEREIAHLNLMASITLAGFRQNPYSAIAQAEALILSSRQEGLPTVLVESMYLSTPVIAFDCPTGPRELIRNGCNGALISPQDVEQLASTILDYRALPREGLLDTVKPFKASEVARSYMEYL